MDANKKKALEIAISQIEKDYGRGSIMKMNDKNKLAMEVISSGSLLVDAALGVGGFPKGRIVELFGPESSGKTTVSLHAIAQAQAQGGTAAFIDAEHALDPQYAAKLGVNIDELLVSQPDFGEQALEICETLVRSGAVDIIVIDSVAALVPKSELDGEMGQSQMGVQARLMSQALRKLTAIVAKSNTVIIFVNQLREKIGVMFGNPETTPGGRALKFYSSIRLEVRRIESIKKGTEIIGNRVRVKIAKNKVAPPFKKVEVEIIFGEGLSHEAEILDLALQEGLIEKSGTWFSYQGERIGQGKENAKLYLKEHVKEMQKIEKIMRSKLFAKKEEKAVPEKRARKSKRKRKNKSKSKLS